MRLVGEQVERFGARPAGSAAARRLARRLRTLLPHGHLEAIPGHPGLHNVVGSLPGRGAPIVVGAHFDTNDTPPGYLGANDGAAGTAAVVELARTLRAARRPASAPPILFALFDGEEAPSGCEPFESCGLRGSKAFVARHDTKLRGMVLLDYIAGRGTRLPREGTSDRDLWRRLRTAAVRVGARATFPPGRGASIIDDHTPFLEAGVPAIDLIDWSYRRYAHTPQDTLERISPRSLDAVGETVARLLLDWPA